MDVAIIGAAGACGRQLAMQLLERRALDPGSSLTLVGHHGGASESELWGLRADLEDAFSDRSPRIDLAVQAQEVRPDIAVMLAGATVSIDPNASADRASLGRRNAALFEEYAQAFGALDDPPVVVVQSNPVELGVHVFSQHLPARRVLGAAGWSDTLRLRHELATDLGVPRRSVAAFVLGQHGDHMVPVWSMVSVHGVPRPDVEALIGRIRRGRSLADLPSEIVHERGRVLDLVRATRVQEAYELVQGLPADLRVAVKPFFTNFTSGRTTEAVTARAAADIVTGLVEGTWLTLPAQVRPTDTHHGLSAPLALPVVLGPNGWVDAVTLDLADDEHQALLVADRAVTDAIADALHG
jgi:malate dehydrogenase